MMITDLIDQDDFYEYLKGAGVPLEQGLSPWECSKAALHWLSTQDELGRAQFAESVALLQKQIPVMLPEVQDALAVLADAL
ncbi:hypothetical protein SAMN03080615_00213 [Amphritea atlantica]|uniref:Uncharacterized protein n=1 Tax=Amphritea atlantica TaxID=355243 RepID=A0A1H9CX95_9GAMM|nr:hypothetical protein [Amphritea atlantica]SEQ05727.1 hypothetical protein SAMN03080615_00213 [Amphritea atlantica]